MATYCPALRGLLAVYRVTYCLDRGIQCLSLAFLGEMRLGMYVYK